MNEHKNLNLYIILGQGIYYGVANECMNKMKEMGLSNSEEYTKVTIGFPRNSMIFLNEE